MLTRKHLDFFSNWVKKNEILLALRLTPKITIFYKERKPIRNVPQSLFSKQNESSYVHLYENLMNNIKL